MGWNHQPVYVDERAFGAVDDRRQIVGYVHLASRPVGGRLIFDLEVCDIKGILATPPKATPPRNKALLRVY